MTYTTPSVIDDRPLPAHKTASGQSTLYYTTQELLKRGWTRTLINRMLGRFDVLLPNPTGRSRAAMKAWYWETVEAIEATSAWAQAVETSQRRKEAARQGVETKRQRLMEQMDAVPIHIPVLPERELTQRAIDDYNAHKRVHHPFRADATLDAPEGFLRRTSVNYARHHMSSYERALEEIAGRVGVEDALTEIRRRVYAAIAEAYPHLAGECDRQFRKKCGEAVPDDTGTF